MSYISARSLQDGASSVFVERFTDGTDYTSGTTTQLTTTEPLPSANSVWVYFDGVMQHHSEYGVSGFTVTFSSAIPTDTADVEIQFNKLVNVGVPGENTVTQGMLTDANANKLLQMRKNVIINGDFDVWQRNISQTVDGYGSDDRWLNNNLGTTKVASRQTFILGQTDVPNNPKYYSRTVVTSVPAASNYSTKAQKIEGVRTFAGETITLSFYAKADASKNIAIEIRQIFGTGGAPSADVDAIGVTTINLITTWQKFTTTITVPSISGKTIGTDNNDYFQLGFWLDGGTDYDARNNSLGQQSGTFDIAQIQIESGDTATDFERRSYGEELALCQRYYQLIYNSEGAYVNIAFMQAYDTVGHQGLWHLPVALRDVNNAVISHAGNWKVRIGTADRAISTIGYLSFGSTQNIIALDVIGTGYVIGEVGRLAVLNDAEGWLDIDCEL